jgi:hypothetical protein
LDLAAEEDWPKDKLRERIDAIRQEAADLRTSSSVPTNAWTSVSKSCTKRWHCSSTPQAAYVRGNELVKGPAEQGVLHQALRRWQQDRRA